MEDSEFMKGYVDNSAVTMVKEVLDVMVCIGINKSPKEVEIYLVSIGNKGGGNQDSDGDLLPLC